MQQHTGQHLLTAVAQARHGWATTAFHLGGDMADIELDAARMSPDALAALEAEVAAEIRLARPVTCRRVAPEDLPGLEVRSRGLPEGFQGDVRLVEIQGLDLNTCGGTHLRSTAELEGLCLLGTETVRGGTRLFFVAGGRARRRMAAHEQRNAALRALLGAPDPGLEEAVAARLEQQRGLDKRIRLLEEELAELLAGALAERAGTWWSGISKAGTLAFLQRAARQLVARAPAKTAFLTATRDGQAFFLLASGDASPVDTAALGREARGPPVGPGRRFRALFQGKAGSLEARAQVLARLRKT